MAELRIELKPLAQPARLPQSWGGPRLSGPRIEQLMDKFVSKNLNVPLAVGGTIRPTAWSHERLASAFFTPFKPYMQELLGPPDGILLVLRESTVRQDGDCLRISSLYTIESASLDPQAELPEIGRKLPVINQALGAAVRNLIPADLDPEIKCSLGERTLGLALSIPL
jgi:hypothetical protein